jgi:ABC-type phosphate transport system substrate-binding protein
MKLTLSSRWCALAAAFLVASAGVFAAPAVVANKDVAAEKIDAAGLKAILLGKKVSWDGAGGRVILAVLKSGQVADDFLTAAAGMSSSAFNNHWRRLAMTGGGTSPHSFETEDELLKFVASTPGAIGFVDEAKVDGTVAVLKPTP